jgi:hypothetical protein
VQAAFERVVRSILTDLVSSDPGGGGGLYLHLRHFLLTHQLLQADPLFAASVFTLAGRPLQVWCLLGRRA